MDLVIVMSKIPRPGETLLGGRFATYPGGKGANQAVAAKRLGANVSLVGKVGNDAFGEQLYKIIQSEGIVTSYIGVDKLNSSGVALITVDSKGQNSISVASGANFALTVQEVKVAWKQINKVDLLVMPMESPLDTIVCSAKLAKVSGARIILNPAPAQDLGDDLLKIVDVIIPNESEAERLTGQKISSMEDFKHAGVSLLARGVGSVVITLGEKGVLLVEGNLKRPIFNHIPAYCVATVDTTAAGDAFVGALATALGEGLKLLEAAHFANAAAALSVTKSGAQPSLPWRNEVEEFLSVQPHRGENWKNSFPS
jgi:ribokinase